MMIFRPVVLLLFVSTNWLLLLQHQVQAQEEEVCTDCACLPVDYQRIGLCNYCNNTSISQLMEPFSSSYDTICGSDQYPTYMKKQLTDCNHYEIGDIVLVMYYHHSGAFHQPVTSIPFQCDMNDVTSCDIRSSNNTTDTTITNRHHQKCNGYGYCSYPVGTITKIPTNNQSMIVDTMESKTCYYEVQFNTDCYPQTSSTITYPQDWLLPLQIELAEMCADGSISSNIIAAATATSDYEKQSSNAATTSMGGGMVLIFVTTTAVMTSMLF